MDEKMRELLEKAKLTAVMAADGAVKVAGTASRKGSQLVEKTKRSAKIFDLNNEVELLMREIGRMVYLTHTGVETDEAELEEKLQHWHCCSQLRRRSWSFRLYCPCCNSW